MPKAVRDLPRGRATSYDVALRAGVSQSAVSRCFREGASIAPATKAKVLEAAQELGYQPNAIASGLITKRSNIVAVLISTRARLYYPEVLAELTRLLSQRDMQVLLFDLQTESDVNAALHQVWRYWVDGAIVAAQLSSAQIREFEKHHVPMVLYNRYGEGEAVSSVCCDSVAGERILVDLLLAAGHQRFGIISGPQDSYVGRQRVETALQRIRESGKDALVVGGAFDFVSGEEGLRKLMEMSENHLDAVVCANDLMAIGAVEAARAAGLCVPQDLSIVGFDGVGPANWPSYQITTIQQPVGRMTAAAVDMLMERIDGPDTPPEVRTFAGKLIPGASARLNRSDGSGH